ncbi:hemicentin-1 isoform X3 [Nematostella vectensis]|uniref:hemicentin-1 isoform X3 n=1 Tax=Nematostella vectensis TaxID=45351 RepID=UPI0020771C2A|nr:hemicentin-1 isoform X3 [Nematostella vectensis]
MYLLGAPRSWLVTGFIFIVSFLPHTGAIRITSKPENITKVLQGTLIYNVSWYWNITPPATISIRVADILVKGVKIGALMDGSPPTPVVFTDFKSRYSLSTATFNPITLIIKDVQPQDAGEYAMILADSGGKNTFEASKFTLDVLVPPGVTPGANVTVNKTDKAELSCSATGNPTPNVTWTRSGGADVLGTGETLTISDVKISDGGCYVCTAYNNIGSEASGTVCLTVQYAPNATISVNTTLVCQGDHVALTCTADDSFPPVIGYHFYRGGTLIVTSSNNEYTAAASTGLPEFNEFTCAAYNLAGGGHNASVTVQAKVPPAITGFSPPQNVAEGSEVMLECNATGSSPNITIERNGEAQLSTTGKHTFAAISRREEGSYRCIVHNGGECPTVYSTTNITVNYKPENTTLTPSTASSCQHDMVTLTCDAAAKPVARYHIYVNGELNTTTTNNTHTVRLENTGSVQFTCVPENDVGTGKNATVTINVKAAPSITFITANMTVTEGSLLNLQCNTSGSLPLNVSWSKVGAAGVLASSGSQEFSSITRAQDGTYECMVHNGDECRAASQRVTITVNYKPENCSLTTNTSSNTYLKGDDVMFSCHAHSKPSTCNATLLHDGTSVTSLTDQTCSGLVTSHVVHNIQGCNAERYSCRMSNVAGQCDESITLTINDPASVHVTSTTPSGDTFASNITVIEGESLTLNCTATGCPTPNITWTKQGVSAALRSNITTEIIHQIASVQKSHAGRYTCAANNEIGAVSRTLSVTVHYKPINTQLTSTKTRACVNDSITLNCTSEAQPAVYEYLFYRNGVHHQTSASGVLHLNPPLAGDHVYTCVPNNTVGTGVNKTVQIAVKAAPSITFINANMTVTEGSLVNLQCNTSGSLPLNVSWSKVGAAGVLSSSGSHEFSSITRTQDGTYKCMVHNGDECPAASQRVTITVNYKPINTQLATTKTSACVNDSITLNCTSEAQPAVHEYLFYRNGVHHQTSASGVLHLNPPLAGDHVYTCVPNNTVGTGVNKTVQIAVKAAPSITFITANMTVTEGSLVNLQCNTSGSLPLNVSWSKVGAAGALSSSGSHEFSSITRAQDGTYECMVHNGDECRAASQRVTITVNYKPEATQFSLNTSDGAYLKGEPVSLYCNSSAKPALCHVVFRKNDVIIKNYTSDTCSASHVISSVEGCDRESFSCQAFNIAGTGDEVFYNATIQDAPAIISVMSQTPQGPKAASSIALPEGETLTLNCTASGCPAPNITWYKHDSASYLSTVIGRELVHQFPSLKKTDKGRYVCTVGAENKTITLDVQYKPINTQLTSTKTRACVNDSITLNCTSEAQPAVHEYLFHRNGVHHQTSASGVLHLNPPLAGDHVYTCVPNNTVGTGVNKTVHITVKAAPSITFITANMTVTEGSLVNLQCNTSGSLPLNVSWSKVGAAGAPSSSGSHELSSITRAQEGTYECMVRNGDECAAASQRVTITLNYKPHGTKLSASTARTCANETMTLNCTGLASPPVHVYHLYRNGDVVDESATGMFVISPTLAGDNAYTCVPNNTLGTGQNSSVHITTTAPPRIHGITSDLTVTEGSNVALQCNATGSEPLNVTWRSTNGAFLSSGVTLNLNILSRNDEGSYQCSASNGNECPVAEESVFVTVIYKPENTSITASKRMACVNDSVTLTCSSTAKPAADRYIYYRGDSLIHNGTSGTHTFTLSAHGTHEYACVASNTAGTGDNSSVVITVQDPPTITHPPSDVTVARGSAASLSCNASGTPPLNISWSRPGSSFYYEGAVLTIDSAATQDDGVYRCVVHNGAHCASRSASATLNVNYKPSITSLSNTTVIAGDILRLYCNTSGKPQANITWSGPSGAGNLPSGNPLVLTSVIKEHAGKYLCNASNSMGWAVESAHVDVQYPPTIVTTPKNTTAYLGGNVTLYCNASSHPAPQIYWAKNGIHIAMGEVLRVAVSSSTAGTYTCTASNGDGANATASASVTVESSCQSNSCKNGGTCVSRGRTFECTCTSDYTGSTCETELSTPMPTSPPNIVYEAEVSVRCKDELYVAELKNKDSPQFKDLEKRFLEQSYRIWIIEKNFLRCSVKSFNNGSVIVNFIVSFNETKSEEAVLQRMQTTVSSGYYGTFKVDPDSVKVTSVTTLCSSSPCKYEDSTCVVHGNGYKCECSTFRYGTHCEKGVGVLPGIVIIAACGAVIFVLLVLLIWCCCCSRRSSYPKDLEQDGTNLNTFSTNDHPNLLLFYRVLLTSVYLTGIHLSLMTTQTHFSFTATCSLLFILQEYIQHK